MFTILTFILIISSPSSPSSSILLLFLFDRTTHGTKLIWFELTSIQSCLLRFQLLRCVLIITIKDNGDIFQLARATLTQAPFSRSMVQGQRFFANVQGYLCGCSSQRLRNNSNFYSNAQKCILSNTFRVKFKTFCLRSPAQNNVCTIESYFLKQFYKINFIYNFVRPKPKNH